MSYELLVFDWDGTLMDSHARIVSCLRSAVAAVGLEPRSDSELRDIIGLGLDEAMQRLFPGIGERDAQRLIASYREHFLHLSDIPESLFEGVGEILETLAAEGHMLAVATGKSRAGLNRALRGTGLAQRFHATRCADETWSKPHPRMLEEIILETGVDSEATLMIGDTEFDLEMARNAGAASLGVTYGAHDASRLARHGPVACIDDIRELPGALADIGARGRELAHDS